MKPLVSIVTPTYQMAGYLQDAIESVLGQDYPEVQYIVVDGASNDDTMQVLRGYGERLQWCSEPDKGTADAIRKGFEAAEGSILGWVNADDRLLPGAISAAVKALNTHPEAVAVYANGLWTDERWQPIRPYPTHDFDLAHFARECYICQPACFFRASAYREIGGIDIAHSTVFDWDLWIRLARQGPFHRAPGDWACSRMHRGNKTLAQRRIVLDEGARLLARHFGYVPFDWVYARLCFERDGRDQFFEPLQPSVLAWLRSLPVGLEVNPGQRTRFVQEWAGVASTSAALRQVRRWLGMQPG